MTGKVLITGGAGFIGGFLARALEGRGWTVDILDNFRRGRTDEFLRNLLSKPTVSLIECDLTGGPDAIRDLETDYDLIFHFAALLGVQNVIDRPNETLRLNHRLLETALDLAERQKNLARFVFASTSEVYAGSLETIGLTIPTPEDQVIALPDLGRPRTSYMLSKLHGEALVRLSGVPHTIVRPHNVYGPRMGQSHVIPQLLQKAYDAPDGKAIEVFSVDHTRTFCFIDDAVEMAICVAVEPACLSETLNLGVESPEHKIGDVAQCVIDTVGKNITIQPGPETQGSPRRRCPDMSKMERLTGYRATTSLADGVRQTYDWYRPTVFEGAKEEVAV